MKIVKALITLPRIKCLSLLKCLFADLRQGGIMGRICALDQMVIGSNPIYLLYFWPPFPHKEWDDNTLTLNRCEDEMK